MHLPRPFQFPCGFSFSWIYEDSKNEKKLICCTIFVQQLFNILDYTVNMLRGRYWAKIWTSVRLISRDLYRFFKLYSIIWIKIKNSDSCIYLLKIRLNIIVNNVFNYRIQKKWKIRDKNDTNISRSDNPSRSKSTMKYWAWQCIETRAEHLSSSRIWFTFLWFFSRLHFLPKYMVKLFELSHECRKYNRYKRNTMRLEKMDQ